MDQPNEASSVSNRPARPSVHGTGKPSVLVIVAFIVVAAGGFVGRLEYQKGKGTTVANAASTTQGTRSGFAGGAGRARMGGFGTVTAVSSSSITISDRQSSSTKTYSITSATTITDNGSTVPSSDIQTGDRVMIRTSSTTSTVATSISVNPTMQGGPGAAATGGSTSTSDNPTPSTTVTN